MAKNRRGATLVELMVAVAILSVGILGFFGAFQFITKSLHVSRTRTLATNLAGERIETLKNLPYYNLLITTATAIDSRVTPNVTYDTANYPPQTIVIGGITFTRYTFVGLAQIDNDVISTVTYTFPDTGMKLIQSTILWNDLGIWRKWSLTNLLENPNIDPLDSSLSGNVVSSVAGNPAVASAVVKIQENPDWNMAANAAGGYNFRVYHGSYTVRASSAGYYDGISAQLVTSAGSNTPVPNITLTPIATGTIQGLAWYNPNLVISQIVVSTIQANDGFDAEYVELFNPTTHTITVGGATPGIKLNYKSFCPGSGPVVCTDATHGIKMNYIATTVGPGQYYLMANTGTFVLNGQIRNADAVFADNANAFCGTPPGGAIWNTGASPPLKKLVNLGHNGSFFLTDSAGTVLDTFAWDHVGSGSAPTNCEGPCIVLPAGATVGDQMIRISSPAATFSDLDNYGRAYDSDVNQVDFLYPPLYTGILHLPSSSTVAGMTVITGVPAWGASVTTDDPLSGSTQAVQSFFVSGGNSYTIAPFKLVGVTTGTWNLDISLTDTGNNYYQNEQNVVVNQNQATWVPNAATTPAWISSSLNGLFMSSSTSSGFVNGTVVDASLNPLNGIQVNAGGVLKTTGANGRYFATVSTGIVSVVANPNEVNPAYVQQIFNDLVQTGIITPQNFNLSLGGALQGYMTAGTTPLPNYPVAATIGGSQYGSGTSNTSGIFTVKNLAVGTYTVFPVLVPGMDSTPNTLTAVVSSSVTVFIGTFTVNGAPGNIAGTVTNSGAAVTSGSLVVASASPIGTTPPAIAASSAPALTPIYSISSLADGTYTLPVAGNNTYYLSVFVPLIAGNGTVSVTTKTYTSIFVNPSLTTTQNVVLP